MATAQSVGAGMSDASAVGVGAGMSKKDALAVGAGDEATACMNEIDAVAAGAGKGDALAAGCVGAGAGMNDTDVPAVGAGKCAASTAWSEGMVGGVGTKKIWTATAGEEGRWTARPILLAQALLAGVAMEMNQSLKLCLPTRDPHPRLTATGIRIVGVTIGRFGPRFSPTKRRQKISKKNRQALHYQWNCLCTVAGPPCTVGCSLGGPTASVEL